MDCGQTRESLTLHEPHNPAAYKLRADRAIAQVRSALEREAKER